MSNTRTRKAVVNDSVSTLSARKWHQIEDGLSRLSFVVVSHVAFTGHAQELKFFLKRHGDKLLFISHPFSFAPQKNSVAEFYDKGVLKAKLKAPKISGPEVFLYFKDFFFTFYFVLKFRQKFNVFVGVDPLNALAGLILKRLGFAKITIFYVIDYVPTRFKNSILNIIYRSFDKLCVRNSDYTWNLTYAMTEAREKIGIRKEDTRQIVVPTGTHAEKIKSKPSEDLYENSIVFLSHLRKGQGIELVLQALPEVLKEIPAAKLIVIGTGPLENYFKEEVEKRGLGRNVTFFGYIESQDEIEKIVAKCRVGIAPYVPDPKSFTWYADPGKPKVYIGCGIPVIITKVPEVAFEISERKAGIVINYDALELSEAIKKILHDDKAYAVYKANAIKFAHELTWDKIFTTALSQIVIFQKANFRLLN